MGRKAVKKPRNRNPKRKMKYLMQLMPIFYEHGLQEFSMDDICEKLDVSKATLYNYFATKEDMVAAILETVLEEIGSFEPIMIDKQRTFLDRYFTSVQILTKALTGISNKFLEDLQSQYPNLWDVVKRFRDYAASVLNQFYEEGKQIGILSGYSTDILVLSDRLFFDALIEPKVLKENNLTIESAFHEYFKLKCFGMINLEQDKSLKSEAMQLLNNLNL